MDGGHPASKFKNISFTNRRANRRLSDFLFQGENKMSALTSFAAIIATLFLIWAVWFIIRFIQYVGSGEYEMDQRLRDICK